MALPSFLPFRFPPSSISPLLKFHSSLLIYRSRIYFSSLFFSLFFFLLCHRSFFPRSSCFINRRSCLFTVEYIALSSISSQFLRFYRILPSRFDVPFTEPLWSSALFPFLFSPSAPLITPEMIFFCAPLYIYAPFAARFRTFLLRSFAFVMTGIIYLISFYASTIYIRRLVTRLSLSLLWLFCFWLCIF